MEKPNTLKNFAKKFGLLKMGIDFVSQLLEKRRAKRALKRELAAKAAAETHHGATNLEDLDSARSGDEYKLVDAIRGLFRRVFRNAMVADDDQVFELIMLLKPVLNASPWEEMLQSERNRRRETLTFAYDEIASMVGASYGGRVNIPAVSPYKVITFLDEMQVWLHPTEVSYLINRVSRPNRAQ